MLANPRGLGRQGVGEEGAVQIRDPEVEVEVEGLLRGNPLEEGEAAEGEEVRPPRLEGVVVEGAAEARVHLSRGEEGEEVVVEAEVRLGPQL